jgi:hypothetical protein
MLKNEISPYGVRTRSGTAMPMGSTKPEVSSRFGGAG